MSLFIHTYLDEDVDVLVAELLRGRGFEATTTLEAGQLGATDEAQLAFATAQGWTILTHNRVDFDALVSQWVTAGRPHAGVIAAVRRPAPELARRLLTILNHVTADEMSNQLRYI